MGHHPAAKYRATRLPRNFVEMESGVMTDPSGDFRDGSDERALRDTAALRHCVILRLLGWTVRVVTKARQAIVKGNIEGELGVGSDGSEREQVV